MVNWYLQQNDGPPSVLPRVGNGVFRNFHGRMVNQKQHYCQCNRNHLNRVMDKGIKAFECRLNAGDTMCLQHLDHPKTQWKTARNFGPLDPFFHGEIAALKKCGHFEPPPPLDWPMRNKEALINWKLAMSLLFIAPWILITYFSEVRTSIITN